MHGEKSSKTSFWELCFLACKLHLSSSLHTFCPSLSYPATMPETSSVFCWSGTWPTEWFPGLTQDLLHRCQSILATSTLLTDATTVPSSATLLLFFMCCAPCWWLHCPHQLSPGAPACGAAISCCSLTSCSLFVSVGNSYVHTSQVSCFPFRNLSGINWH